MNSSSSKKLQGEIRSNESSSYQPQKFPWKKESILKTCGQTEKALTQFHTVPTK